MLDMETNEIETQLKCLNEKLAKADYGNEFDYESKKRKQYLGLIVAKMHLLNKPKYYKEELKGR